VADDEKISPDTEQDQPRVPPWLKITVAVVAIVGGLSAIAREWWPEPPPKKNGTVEDVKPVTWRLLAASEPVPPFLKSVRDELPDGASDPLNRPENRGLALRQELDRLRESALERPGYDYVLYYSSSLQGNLDTLSIGIAADVRARMGVRLFSKEGHEEDSQIVPCDVLREIDTSFSFSRSTLKGIERALVFLFPLNASSARLLAEREYTKNMTIETRR